MSEFGFNPRLEGSQNPATSDEPESGDAFADFRMGSAAPGNATAFDQSAAPTTIPGMEASDSQATPGQTSADSSTSFDASRFLKNAGPDTETQGPETQNTEAPASGAPTEENDDDSAVKRLADAFRAQGTEMEQRGQQSIMLGAPLVTGGIAMNLLKDLTTKRVLTSSVLIGLGSGIALAGALDVRNSRDKKDMAARLDEQIAAPDDKNKKSDQPNA